MSSVKHQAYRYEPFPSNAFGGHHIRVLRLPPGAPDSPVRFELLVRRLPHAEGTYEAVSCAWGNPNDTLEVECLDGDGLPRLMLITRSLHSALLRLRDTYRDRYLWADACCINQQDKLELGQQVAIMRSFYALARRVLVWLGTDEEDVAEDAVGLCVELYQIIKENGKEFSQPTASEQDDLPNLFG